VGEDHIRFWQGIHGGGNLIQWHARGEPEKDVVFPLAKRAWQSSFKVLNRNRQPRNFKQMKPKLSQLNLLLTHFVAFNASSAVFAWVDSATRRWMEIFSRIVSLPKPSFDVYHGTTAGFV
jgi:hypothetical protein